MKNKIKFYIFRYFILIVIFFSLIKSTDFLKKVYFLNKYNYNQRIGKNYDFCKNGSVPFLHFLKSKYKLKKKVKIVDYEINPNSGWVFFDLNHENIYKDKLILLNYEKEKKIKFFKLKNGLFVSNKNPPHIFKIEKAIFSTNNNNNIDTINLEITNRSEDKIQILLSKSFIFANQSKEINLNLNIERFKIRLGKLFIEITNDENNLKNIKNITLKLNSIYNLNDYKVLEKIDNCYFLERLS